MIQIICKHKLFFALLIAFLYQFICIIQGLDLSDEGWLMYFYQQIFKNPESVGAQMPYWFTGVIGGLWYKLWPDGGFFSMRLFGVILNTGMFYLIYHFLKRFINSPWLLVGLLAQVLIIAGDPKPFGYNSLSAFFVIIAVILFFNGMEKRNFFFLFLGGFVLGLNVFVRIPNIAYIVFLLLIPIYIYLKNRKISIINKEIIISIVGFTLAFTLCIYFMMQLGHWNLFMASFDDTMASASDETNSHELGTMLLRYGKNYLKILLTGLILGLWGLLYNYFKNKINNPLYIKYLKIIFIIILGFLSVIFNMTLRDNDMFFVNFISLLGIGLCFLNWRRENYTIKFISIAALFMILFISMGSDQGIKTMWTSTWMPLPFSVAYIYQYIKDLKCKFGKLGWTISKKSIIEYCGIILIVYFITGIYKVDFEAYYDPGSRNRKTHSINNKFCKHIYTLRQRTTILNELLDQLDKYVQPNDYLLAYYFLPGLNYMTDTRSYLPNSWLWGYSGKNYEYELNKSIQEKRVLPVVVRQHFFATNNWRSYDPYFYSEEYPNKHFASYKHIRVMNLFLEINKYERVWSNKYFEILIPPEL